MIKVVVFDLDDTLFPEFEYVKSGFREVAKEISAWVKKDSESIYEALVNIFKTDSIKTFNRVLEKYNYDYSNDDILRLIYTYRTHTPSIRYFDDALSTIEQLKSKDLKIGIITDGYSISQHKKLYALGAHDIFHKIVVSDDIGRNFWKPHKITYKIIKNYFDVDYSEMIYVGDNELKDFKGANDLGIETIKINRNNDSKAHKLISCRAKYQITDLYSLTKFI